MEVGWDAGDCMIVQRIQQLGGFKSIPQGPPVGCAATGMIDFRHGLTQTTAADFFLKKLSAFCLVRPVLPSRDHELQLRLPSADGMCGRGR